MGETDAQTIIEPGAGLLIGVGGIETVPLPSQHRHGLIAEIDLGVRRQGAASLRIGGQLDPGIRDALIICGLLELGAES